jgi:hypothetical protein
VTEDLARFLFMGALVVAGWIWSAVQARREKASPKPARPASAKRPPPPARGAPPPLPSAKARRASADPGGLPAAPRARLDDLQLAVASDARLAPLRPALGALERASAGAGGATRTHRAEELLRAATLQRLAEGPGGSLATADALVARIAHDARDPRFAAQPLVPMHPVAGGVARFDPSLPFTLVLVPPDVARHPWRWAHVVRETWLARLRSDESTASQLRAEIGASDPDLWEDAGHRAVSAALADESAEIAADAAASLALGPAWLDALEADAAPRPVAERAVLRPAPEPFGAHLPSDYRMAVGLSVLEGAGLGLEAQERRDRLERLRGRPPAFARAAPSGLEYFRRDTFEDHAGHVAYRLRRNAISSLGGPLASLAPLAGTLDVATMSDPLRESMRRGETVRGSWRQVIAALATLGGADLTPAVLAARPAPGMRERSRHAHEAPATASATSLRDRATLRDALLLGEVLTPPSLRGSFLAIAVILVTVAGAEGRRRDREAAPPLTAGEQAALGELLVRELEATPGSGETGGAGIEGLLSSIPPPEGTTWRWSVLTAGSPGAFALPGGRLVVTSALLENDFDPCRRTAALVHAAAHALDGDPERLLEASHGPAMLREMLAGGREPMLSALVANLASGGAFGWHGRGAERAADARAAGLMAATACDPATWPGWLSERGAARSRYLRAHPRPRGD